MESPIKVYVCSPQILVIMDNRPSALNYGSNALKSKITNTEDISYPTNRKPGEQKTDAI
jgi:hypothetical protein